MNVENKLNYCHISVVENGYLVRAENPKMTNCYQEMWVFNSVDDLGEWIKKSLSLKETK